MDRWPLLWRQRDVASRSCACAWCWVWCVGRESTWSAAWQPPPALQLLGCFPAGGPSVADMALQGAALKAAAMGAGTAVKVEAVSPVDKSAMNKAFRSESCSTAHGLPLPFTSLLAIPPLPQLPWLCCSKGLKPRLSLQLHCCRAPKTILDFFSKSAAGKGKAPATAANGKHGRAVEKKAPEAAPQPGRKRLKQSAAAPEQADLELTEQVRPLDIVAKPYHALQTS